MTPVAIPPLPFLPEAVVFDMDGLMLDSERAINECMARSLSISRPSMSKITARAIMG